MSSRDYNSEDKMNFELEFSPRNRGAFACAPIVTPNKLNKDNLEKLLGNYTPVITVSSSSASEKRSSKIMNPFNDTISSQPRNSKLSFNDGIESSNSSYLQTLLPPISFNEHTYSKYGNCDIGISPDKCKQDSIFSRGINYVLQKKRPLPTPNDNLIVSSPVMQSQDLVIDKDLLTSEADHYNDHLYPWLVRQDSEAYPIAESSLLQETPLDTEESCSANNTDIECKSQNSFPIYEIEKNKNLCNKEINFDHETVNNIVKTTPLSRGRKPKKKGNSDKKSLMIKLEIPTGTVVSEDQKLFSLPQMKQSRRASLNLERKTHKRKKENFKYKDKGADTTVEDEEYLPNYKITRSRSRKNRLSLDNYPEASEKKKKIGPRSKSGCWTCRVRHKACPEERPQCTQCSRLNLRCDYSSTRPKYMTDPVLQANKLKEIRNITFKQKRSNFTKGK